VKRVSTKKTEEKERLKGFSLEFIYTVKRKTRRPLLLVSAIFILI
jgi:hypothetical protein